MKKLLNAIKKPFLWLYSSLIGWFLPMLMLFGSIPLYNNASYDTFWYHLGEKLTFGIIIHYIIMFIILMYYAIKGTINDHKKIKK